MGPNERLLAAHKAQHAALMTRGEAIELEARLTDNATIRRLGTVRITDEDKNTTIVEGVYAVADMIRLLDAGNSPLTILRILESSCSRSYSVG